MLTPYKHRAAAARWALVADEAEYLRSQLAAAPEGADNDAAHDAAARTAELARAREEAHCAYASLTEALADVAERLALLEQKYGGAA
jgi:hypothetical protein